MSFSTMQVIRTLPRVRRSTASPATCVLRRIACCPTTTKTAVRPFHTTLAARKSPSTELVEPGRKDVSSNENSTPQDKPRAEHAVISAFGTWTIDLFSIGVGPSSSHTVGPMRAGKIFVEDLKELGLLKDVHKLKIGLYGSLAATGKGHMTPQAVVLGLEGEDPETIEPSTIQSRYASILKTHHLTLAGEHSIVYDQDKDMLWRNEPLPTHPNGMRFSVYAKTGDLLAVNEYFSVGGGFVVNDQTKIDENLYYRAVKKKSASSARREQTHGLETNSKTQALPAPGQEPSAEEDGSRPTGPKQPPFLFRNGAELLAMTKRHNLTIAQLVWENERSAMTSEEISEGLMKLWRTMDASIAQGVASTELKLPGGLGVRRRAPGLYRRLFKGFYPSLSPSEPSQSALPPAAPSSTLTMASGFNSEPPPEAITRLPSGSIRRTPLVIGSFEHELAPIPFKKAVFPGIDFLSCYAIAVNETNASGGRVVTSPTLGAAGVIPAVGKYIVEFISDDPEGDIKTFLLTAAAVGMLYKRGATISAAEGGCMAEVGVASSMAAAGFTACMGGSPQQILQAAEIGIEHSLGLTCDPHEGLVQVPCIERNSIGAVKAVAAAQLALASDGRHSVSLDEAIEAMHTHYKETSMSGLAVGRAVLAQCEDNHLIGDFSHTQTSVRIPLSSPAC
ncbi:BZ3500_MvSof-1268-A1-R1_Chr3-1g05462 [Microbotryum saponariae]|uniref:BZ3500_MvSof-1268-A1-R1_Chr3-1g05462 protein n=1 Tax=Microbotryum saponariae TaxID=289078 RepID=A0A2X0LYW0_9BASI|nr:BZ3500_MvSof-1268-A1-R1_Chr3-1g05462 [Microbotryum saponariae]SDA04653.1 BZ3501_MvSof-1269-A2-R1_Chr3-1g05133 [Microbotryum saponariae]